MAQPFRQCRLAALKRHDGQIQVIQGNGDFHKLIGGGCDPAFSGKE
jgi:hypothetical protein